MTTSRQANVDAVLSSLRAFNRGDIESILAPFASDAKLRDDTLDRDFASPLEYVGFWPTVLDGPQVQNEEVWPTGEKTVRAKFFGVANGVSNDLKTTFGTLYATGSPIRLRFTSDYVFEGGKIVKATSSFRPAS